MEKIPVTEKIGTEQFEQFLKETALKMVKKIKLVPIEEDGDLIKSKSEIDESTRLIAMNYEGKNGCLKSKCKFNKPKTVKNKENKKEENGFKEKIEEFYQIKEKSSLRNKPLREDKKRGRYFEKIEVNNLNEKSKLKERNVNKSNEFKEDRRFKKNNLENKKFDKKNEKKVFKKREENQKKEEFKKRSTDFKKNNNDFKMKSTDYKKKSTDFKKKSTDIKKKDGSKTKRK